MSKVCRFEDLIAWQKAKALAIGIYRQSRQLPFKADFRFAAQIQSAAVSVMSNIAEGYERGSAAEFHQFLVVAKASCAEVRSQLYLAYETGHISSSQFQYLHSLAEETSRILGGLKSAVKAAR